VQEYIDKVYELIPAIIVAIFGGLSGEIIRGDKRSKSGRGDVSRMISFLVVWIFSGLMAWAIIIDMDLPLGANILIIGMSSFLSKEFLSILSSAFIKRFKKYNSEYDDEKGEGKRDDDK
jgi:hypothetical protein